VPEGVDIAVFLHSCVAKESEEDAIPNALSRPPVEDPTLANLEAESDVTHFIRKLHDGQCCGSVFLNTRPSPGPHSLENQ